MPRGRPKGSGNKPKEEVVIVETAPQNETLEVSEQAVQPPVKRTGRVTRVPINGYRDILSVDGQEPGYHYVWIEEANTFRMEQAGYSFVSHDVVVGNRRVNAASQIGSKVSIPGGNDRTLYLMRCPDEIFNEEMDLLAKQIDETESTMLQKTNTRTRDQYGEVKIGRGKPDTF